jgi:hypothetical protein
MTARAAQLVLGTVLVVAGIASGQSVSELPRTPWGTPDLQGVWTGSTLTPLERPVAASEREFMTDVEVDRRIEGAVQGNIDRPPAAGSPGTYNRFWYDPVYAVVPDRRSSLIVDPPDGRIPYTTEGRVYYDTSDARYGVGPRDSYLDLDTGERCITDGLPLRYSGYNSSYQIFQTVDHIAILGEMFRDLRIVPLDGRPRAEIPQWLGDGRGRWDGDTLVIETTTFADKLDSWWVTAWRASRSTLRLVERFTRLDEQTIEYAFTMEDPEMFSRPWTATIPLTNDHESRGMAPGPIFEYACHEGNYGLVNTLRGARTLDDK